jgi:hypothetical protein
MPQVTDCAHFSLFASTLLFLGRSRTTSQSHRTLLGTRQARVPEPVGENLVFRKEVLTAKKAFSWFL